MQCKKSFLLNCMTGAWKSRNLLGCPYLWNNNKQLLNIKLQKKTLMSLFLIGIHFPSISLMKLTSHSKSISVHWHGTLLTYLSKSSPLTFIRTSWTVPSIFRYGPSKTLSNFSKEYPSKGGESKSSNEFFHNSPPPTTYSLTSSS